MSPAPALHVVVLSSRSRAALRRTRDRLADHLERRSLPLADVVTTLARGREALPVRAAFPVRSADELVRVLRAADGTHDGPPDPAVIATVPAGRPRPTVWVGDGADRADPWSEELGRRLRARGVPRDEARRAPGDGPVWLVFGDDGRPPGPGPVVLVRPGEDPDDAAAGVVARLWCEGAAVDPAHGVDGARRHLPGPAFARADDPVDDGPGTDATARTPLTFLQQRLLFHDIVRGGGRGEHHVGAGRRTATDPARLSARVEDGATRHPELRTYFREEPSGWRACVRPEGRVRMETRDAASFGPDATDEQLLAALAAEPLPLVDEEPFRAVLVRGPGGEGFLAFLAHRAVTDGATLARLVADAAGPGEAVGPLGPA